jgi:hypothetical protein
MASAAVVYLGEPLGRSADELCDDLLMHMLGCGRCLDPVEYSCGVYHGFQSEIAAKGGATKPVAFAY